MKTNWSLTELYPSFESDAFLTDLLQVDTLSQEYIEFATALNDFSTDISLTLSRYLTLQIKLNTLFEKLFSYCSLTLSANTSDPLALKYSDILNEKSSILASAETIVNEFICSIENIDDYLVEVGLLNQHAFLFHEVQQFSAHLLSDKEEAIIAKMKNTGSTAWEKLKDTLTSTLLVDITLNGEKKQIPLTMARNLAHDPSTDIRKIGYLAELTSYKKIEDSLAACLSGIKGEVLTTCKLHHFESPLEKTLMTSRMDQQTLDAMLSAMQDSLPKFREFLQLKANLLGHENGLPFYDLFAPIGNSNSTYTYDEGCEFVLKHFRSFSDSLADYAKKAMDNAWIDVYPKEGKVGGAFCSNLHGIGESRFLLNYGNQFNDVITLAHELGHGFHGFCLKDETLLNAQYPMPLAETASTFCETIIKKAAIKSGTDEDVFSILETELSDATQIIVDIYSRYLFETKLFDRRAESSLSAHDLCELMVEAQKEAYGEGLDANFLHPYMWACKPHYYYACANFYNFPYAFGLLFAKGLYAHYQKQGDSFPKAYEELLALTGKKSIIDVAKIMNIDVTSKAFWQSSLDIIIEDIETFKQLTTR